MRRLGSAGSAAHAGAAAPPPTCAMTGRAVACVQRQCPAALAARPLAGMGLSAPVGPPCAARPCLALGWGVPQAFPDAVVSSETH